MQMILSCGLIVTIGLSWLNYAVSGFYVVVEVSTTLKDTSAPRWTDSGILSWFSKVKTFCQPSDIPVQTTLYTNNLSMSYILSSIWRQLEDREPAYAPALTYMNETLENCTIPYIEITLESQSRTALQIGWTTWGPSGTVSISNECSFCWLTVLQGYCNLLFEEQPGIDGTKSYDFI